MYRFFSFLLVGMLSASFSHAMERFYDSKGRLQAAMKRFHAGKAKCLTPHSQWIDEDKMHEGDCIGLLIGAILGGNSTHVRILIEQGAPINYRLMMNGNTPIYYAAAFGKNKKLQILLDYGADPTIPNNKRLTPLHVASSRGRVNVVKTLLSHRVYVKHKNAEAFIALKDAWYQTGERFIDLKDNTGATPLHLAAELNRYEVVKLLLEARAEVNPVDKFEMTPLDYAALKGHEAVVKELVNAGAIVQNSTSKSEPLICRVMSRGHETIAHHLIAAGVKPHQARGCENQFEKLTTELYRNQLLSFAMTTVLIIVLIKMFQHQSV